MKLDIGQELIDDIIFAMENQGEDMALDLKQGRVVCVDGDSEAWVEDFVEECDGEKELAEILSEPGRFADLPDWGPADGFRLMEQFVAGLKNPPARQALREALALKKGVFRAFKDALHAHPEVEKLWFAFKDEEMGKTVRAWLEALKEERELEGLALEPEEESEAVLADFSFSFPEALEGAFAALEKAVRLEVEAALPAAFVLPAGKEDFLCIAASASGEPAGLLAGRASGEGGETLLVTLLGIAPEFRGLGLGKELLRRALAQASRRGFSAALIQRPETASFFDDVLGQEGFKPRALVLGGQLGG